MQSKTPNTSFQDRLDQGFERLEERGYFARQDWWCCQNCGVHAVPDEFTNRYVFYHEQDADNLPDGFVHLSWNGDAEEIVRTFEEVGCTVEWNGSHARRIRVSDPSPGLIEGSAKSARRWHQLIARGRPLRPHP
jgi:hypothetical protein